MKIEYRWRTWKGIRKTTLQYCRCGGMPELTYTSSPGINKSQHMALIECHECRERIKIYVDDNNDVSKAIKRASQKWNRKVRKRK